MIYQKVLKILDKKEKFHFGLLMLCICLMAVFQVIGIASILPFMQLVVNPEAIHENEWLGTFYDLFQFESNNQMIIYAGIVVLALMIISNGLSAFTTWFQTKFAWRVGHNIATRLLSKYTNQPYSYYLERSNSNFLTNLLWETHATTTGILIPIANLISGILVTLIVFFLLLIVNVKIALLTILLFGGTYFMIFQFKKKSLSNLGKRRILHNNNRLKFLREIFNGVKTLILYDGISYFFKRFEQHSSDLSKLQPKVTLVSTLPKYIIEIIAFGSIIGITLFLIIAERDVLSIIPILSLYALAGYRMLPALQKSFLSLTTIRNNIPSLNVVSGDIIKLQSTDQIKEDIIFENEIKISMIDFSYQEDSEEVLQNVSISIPKGKMIGLVGATGSGKSTIVDIIVGLFKPKKGSIRIDKKELNEQNAEKWRKLIGYVPQDVYLFDDSVRRNIALGIEDKDIDEELLKKVCKMANILDVINNDLSHGFQTNVGDAGVKLSGGQKQRIGLARALYRKPQVLILDEATSALDSITENKVIESLTKGDHLTIIIIAHRLSTVKSADKIYLIDKGKILNKGSYKELIAASTIFREMAQYSK